MFLLCNYSCLPVSKVECLIQLPSTDIVFSTQRSDIDSVMDSTNQTTRGTTPPPPPTSASTKTTTKGTCASDSIVI